MYEDLITAVTQLQEAQEAVDILTAMQAAVQGGAASSLTVAGIRTTARLSAASVAPAIQAEIDSLNQYITTTSAMLDTASTAVLTRPSLPMV